MRVYSNSLEDKNTCAEIVVRAERLMGEMLKETVTRGRPKETINEKDKPYHDGRVLPDGISYNQSSRFQKAASIPVKEFEKHLTHVRETEGGEITTNGILRLASSLERDVRAKGMEGNVSHHTPAPTYTAPSDAFSDPPSDFLFRSDPGSAEEISDRRGSVMR